jgi:hypothetical protein
MSTLKELLEEQQRLQATIEQVEASIKPQLDPLQVDLQVVKEQINQRASEEATKAFHAAKKDTGTLNFVSEGVQIKAVVEKKVEWDQKELASIWHKIVTTGDKPEEYITRKETYTVPEKSYTAWPEQIRAVFLPARTLTPKPPRFELSIIDPNKPPF